MMRAAALAVAASVCVATQALAQTPPPPPEAPGVRGFVTDRPDKTESPYTVPAGLIQIELDFATYTRDRDRSGGGDVRTRTLNLAPTNFKIGLDRATDLQFVYDAYVRRTTTDRVTGARDRREGAGDLTLRLKHNLWGDDAGAAAFGLMPFVKLPTNTHEIGNNAVEFGLIAPLAIALGDKVGLGLMTEVDGLRKESGSGYAPTFINSATLGFALTDKLGVYSEIYTERSTERGARWVVTGDVGLTYLLTSTLQVDVGVNVGLTRAADDLNVFTGISKRF